MIGTSIGIVKRTRAIKATELEARLSRGPVFSLHASLEGVTAYLPPASRALIDAMQEDRDF
jgi:hypothetical protein